MLAVLLAIVTIASHRTHTAAIMHKSSANDAWSYYQATRIKLHNSELGENLVARPGREGTRPPTNWSPTTESRTKKYEATEQGDPGRGARTHDEAAEADENRALRYDIGEGLLEIGLVLSSLYFIFAQEDVPRDGLIAGCGRAAIRATVWAMRFNRILKK